MKTGPSIRPSLEHAANSMNSVVNSTNLVKGVTFRTFGRAIKVLMLWQTYLVSASPLERCLVHGVYAGFELGEVDSVVPVGPQFVTNYKNVAC